MRIPDVPIVPMDLDERTREFLGSLDDRLDKSRLDKIDAVKVDGNKVYVLGTYDCLPKHYREIVHDMIREESVTSFNDSRGFFDDIATILTLSLYYYLIVIEDKEERIKKYEQKVSEYIQANLTEAEARVKDIRVFQGSVDEVAKELGRPLERVDTGKPETYLHVADTLNLRVQAYHLGANAVVHCQPGSSIGTPVKYADTKSI